MVIIGGFPILWLDQTFLIAGAVAIDGLKKRRCRPPTIDMGGGSDDGSLGNYLAGVSSVEGTFRSPDVRAPDVRAGDPDRFRCCGLAGK